MKIAMAKRTALDTVASEEMLRSVLRFFALSDEEKARFLPAHKPGVTFVYNECGDRTEHPLHYYSSAAAELMGNLKGEFSDEMWEIIGEMWGLLELIAFLPERGYFEFWSFNTNLNRCKGLSEAAAMPWRTLRRLSKIALPLKGWTQGIPNIPFAETAYWGRRGPLGENPEPWLSTKLKSLGEPALDQLLDLMLGDDYFEVIRAARAFEEIVKGMYGFTIENDWPDEKCEHEFDELNRSLGELMPLWISHEELKENVVKWKAWVKNRKTNLGEMK